MEKGLKGGVGANTAAFNGTLSFIISTPNDWNPRVGGICKISVANKQHMAGIACGNWQVHFLSDSAASCQRVPVASRASYGSCSSRWRFYL